MNEYRYFIIFVYFKSIISLQDWNIAGTIRFLLPAEARIAMFAQIRSDQIGVFGGRKEDKWSVCAFMGKQPPAIRDLCRERQCSGPRRTLSFAFSSFINFCQDKNCFGSWHIMGYRCKTPCFLPFLAHLLLNFLFPLLVAGFFSLLTATGNEVERLENCSLAHWYLPTCLST